MIIYPTDDCSKFKSHKALSSHVDHCKFVPEVMLLQQNTMQNLIGLERGTGHYFQQQLVIKKSRIMLVLLI